ncbi:unnamed protein product [Acanthoscelides obtectus]|nr:unnamed protein product [Acanthoscelides obtectus]CAK1632616.1 Histone deacetylase 6 [Acanthoscelides obtectus]
MDPHEAINSYVQFQCKKTGFIEQESPEHYCLWDNNYPEHPGRVSVPRKRLEELQLIERCEKVTRQTFSEELFLMKHTKDLIDKLKRSSSIPRNELEKYSSNWDSVYFTKDTFLSAVTAAESALTLSLKVAQGSLKNGLALIRPPGHHAMKDEMCGYCFLNNVALAADAAISKQLTKKVLIVDHDVHHGQGTQRLFYERDDVLYFSIHRYENGLFWPNLRESESDYIGEGKGKGYTVNVPLNETGMDDSDYLAIIINILLPIAYEFKPDLILISAGFDCAIGCPEGEMNVSPHFFAHLVSLLSGLADGKVVVCLEGGYFLESLAEGVACSLKALLGDFPHPLNIDSKPTVKDSLQKVINNVKYFLREYWECFKHEPSFDYPIEGRDIDEENEHVTNIRFEFVGPVIIPYETTGFYPQRSDDEIKTYNQIVDDYRKEYLNGRKCSNVVGYVYDDHLLKHGPTENLGKTIPERSERLTEIINCCEKFGLKERCKLIETSKHDERSWLEKIHERNYLNTVFQLENVPEKPDWFHNEYTSSCIQKSISSILSLAKAIHSGDIRSGTAIIRPPGHHATFDSSSGFCFVNNVVAAGEYLIRQEKYKRILIVDFDIHHGNGTQNLTYDRSDILYLSVHRFDQGKFFPTCKEADCTYTGKNAGEGYNVNVPFNKGSKGDSDYWYVWHKLVLPIAYSFNPEFVIISAGFDAAYFDPLGGGYQLTPEMYGHFIYTLKSLASGRMLVALEGGYHVESTALSMVACVKALLGDPIPVPNLSEMVSEDTVDTVRNVLKWHKKNWPMLKVNKAIANWCDFTGPNKS